MSLQSSKDRDPNQLFIDGKLALTRQDWATAPEGAVCLQEWNCQNCGEQNIWGDWSSCPTCGTQLDEDWLYIPKKPWIVHDPQMLNTLLSGPYWKCTNKLNATPCGTINDNADTICRTCSGDRDKVGQSFQTTNRRAAINGSQIRTQQREGVRQAASDGVITSVFGEDNAPRDPNILSNLVQKSSLALPISKKWLATVLSLLAVIWTFWFYLFDAIEVDTKVTSFQWSRTIPIEQYVEVSDQGPDVPSDAYNISTFDKVIGSHPEKTGVIVQDGYKTVDDTSAPKIPYDCSETTGSGGAVKKICLRTPTKQIPNMIAQTREVQDYATWYNYYHKVWKQTREVKANGDNQKPYWPKYTLASGVSPERAGTRQSQYRLILKKNNGSTDTVSIPSKDDWLTYRQNVSYIYSTNRLGQVISKPQRILKDKSK